MDFGFCVVGFWLIGLLVWLGWLVMWLGFLHGFVFYRWAVLVFGFGFRFVVSMLGLVCVWFCWAFACGVGCWFGSCAVFGWVGMISLWYFVVGGCLGLYLLLGCCYYSKVRFNGIGWLFIMLCLGCRVVVVVGGLTLW